MTFYGALKTFHQILFRSDRATSDQNPMTLLVGSITSIMWWRATAFSAINFDQFYFSTFVQIYNLTNLFSVSRLSPWHCSEPLWPRWTCLLNCPYYLQPRRLNGAKFLTANLRVAAPHVRLPDQVDPRNLSNMSSALSDTSMSWFLPLRAVLMNSIFPEMLTER